MSSWDDTDNLEAKFNEQVKKGYPKNYKKKSELESHVEEILTGKTYEANEVPF